MRRANAGGEGGGGAGCSGAAADERGGAAAGAGGGADADRGRQQDGLLRREPGEPGELAQVHCLATAPHPRLVGLGLAAGLLRYTP